MSNLTHPIFLANRFGRRTQWPWLCGLLSLLLARAALATDPLYQNDAVLNYTVPGNPPPNIDATNFVNNNTFTVNFSSLVYYEPWNVRNYTNIGYMSANTGFTFDTQTTNMIPRRMANSFYNSANYNGGGAIPNTGEIDCGIQLIVWATNIVNSGTIRMGPYTLMQITGGSVDFSRSLTTM